MKKIISILFLNFIFTLSKAQHYYKSIQLHRENYKKEFLEDKKSPLQQDDLAYLKFYPIQYNFRILSKVEYIQDTIGFDMETHSGIIKKYVKYAKLYFNYKNKKYKLYVYQSIDLKKKEGMEDYLFLPFTDNTNYTETFGGGRYLDFKKSDIKNNTLWIDFNKAYNPYCAYKVGYNCPIPPKENALHISVRAGEKLFGKSIIE